VTTVLRQWSIQKGQKETARLVHVRSPSALRLYLQGLAALRQDRRGAQNDGSRRCAAPRGLNERARRRGGTAIAAADSVIGFR
jgi:hypothetical protein